MGRATILRAPNLDGNREIQLFERLNLNGLLEMPLQDKASGAQKVWPLPDPSQFTLSL